MSKSSSAFSFQFRAVGTITGFCVTSGILLVGWNVGNAVFDVKKMCERYEINFNE